MRLSMRGWSAQLSDCAKQRSCFEGIDQPSCGSRQQFLLWETTRARTEDEWKQRQGTPLALNIEPVLAQRASNQRLL